MILLSGFMTGVAYAAKPPPSVKMLTERCAQEAQDASIPAGGEFNNYVKDCVRDFQELRKQGLDQEGTHEDPAAQAPPPKSKSKVKKKSKPKTKVKKKKNPR